MAATNGKITLMNKLTAIADIIRNKTPNTLGKITMDQMVQEISDEWKIKCYVKSLVIQDIDSDGDWKYVHKNLGGRTNNGVVLSYTTDNDILLTVATNDGGNENVKWVLSSTPEGSNISIHTKSDWKQWSPTGNSGAYQSCIIKGVDRPCNIALDCGETGGNLDIFTINIFITYP